MKRISIILVAVGLLAAGPAQAGTSSQVAAARAAMRDHVAPLFSPGRNTMSFSVGTCRGVGQGWWRCNTYMRDWAFVLRVKPVRGDYMAVIVSAARR